MERAAAGVVMHARHAVSTGPSTRVAFLPFQESSGYNLRFLPSTPWSWEVVQR